MLTGKHHTNDGDKRRRRLGKDGRDVGSSLKKRLVDQCLKHVKEQREGLLERARKARQNGVYKGGQLSLQTDLAGIIQSAEESIISSGSAEMSLDQPSSLASLKRDGCFDEFVDHKRHRTLSKENMGMGHDEYLSLMHMLEQELSQDLTFEEQADEIEYLESLEHQEIDDMVEAHFGSMFSGNQPEGLPGVLCPVCHDNWLVELRGMIACPSGHLCLDGSYEGMGLETLRQRLAGIHEKHSCCGPLRFEQRGSTTPDCYHDTACLIAHCEKCNVYEVII